MLTKSDIEIIKNVVDSAVAKATAPLATKAELRGLATKEDLTGLATKADLTDLATKADISQLDTRIVKLEVKSDANFARLESKMDKGFTELERAIKIEHKARDNDFQYLETEERKIKQRVEKIEHHIGFSPVVA